MGDDLLAKEKEFRRVNKELDERTKYLLEEIDLVVNSQNKNIFSPVISNIYHSRLPATLEDFSIDSSCNIDYKYDEINGDNKVTSPEILTEENQKILDKKTEIEDDFDNIEIFKENKTKNQAMIRLLKEKIKILMSDLQIMKDEYKKKCNLYKDLENENKKINESKDKLNNQIIHLKEIITKYENNIANHQTELQANSAEKNTLKKEIDSLKKEIKGLHQQNNNYDLRLNRSLEDNDKLRQTIKTNKIEEKELRNQIRKLQDVERQTIKILERKNSEILQAFKKQNILIDNLKKQKAYLEANKHVQLTRDEFEKILNWRSDER